MKEVVASIDRSQVACVWFTTRTAPAGEVSWPGIERCRRAFHKRMRRRWGKAFPYCVVWKKEPHKSGWPHLHELVLWLREAPPLGEFRAWGDRAWHEVVGTANEHHERVGCKVEPMKSWSGVSSYCSKYMCKLVPEGRGKTGRIWGVENRSALPVSIREEVVSEAVGVKVRRVLRKLAEKKRAKVKAGSTKVAHRLSRATCEALGCSYAQPACVQVEELKANGLRAAIQRVKVLRHRVVKVWREVVETGGYRPVCRVERGDAETGADEVESYAPGLFFCDSEQALRLVQFFKKEVEDEPPF